MKKHLLSLCVLGLGFSACERDNVKVTSEDDKSLYTIGQMYGRRIEYLNLSKKETDIVLKGAKDWLHDKKSEVDFDVTRGSVQGFVEKRIAKDAEGQKEQGKKFIEQFLKDGGKVTDSGLAYKITKEGSATKPKPEDTVEVHYHGTLTDGTVFDSSVERDQKASFPLNRVIKGWTEGLQLIGEGGEIKLVVPSELAYGERGSPPKIPGGATLVFEVSLFKVSKN